jgi:transposase
MLSESEEKTQNRQGRGRSKTLEVKQPGGEQDRRATTKPAESPNSRWGHKVEPELRKAGSGPKSKWVKVMSQYAELYVGIDVAKRTLEVALSSGEIFSVDNEDAGISQLVEDLVKRAPALVVLEASGGYERKAWLALLEAGIATARVNPRDTHHFAQAHRQLAKTDRLDARGLMLFAAQIRPQPDVAPAAADERLKEMVGRRQQLTTMLTAERNRRQQAITPANRRSIETVIRFLERQRKALDQAIEKHLSKNAQVRELNELLQTAKGVGRVVSATLIARLPELGRLTRRQVAALVGVAPYDRKSGDWDGRSHIFGGRADVRCALYMATLAAVRGDPHLRAFYRRLREQGKEKKVALTACIRKLAITLNAMVKHHTPWRPSCPTLA